MNAIISASELASDLTGSNPPVVLDVRWQLSVAKAAGEPPFDGVPRTRPGTFRARSSLTWTGSSPRPPARAAGIRFPRSPTSAPRCAGRVSRPEPR